jgi:rubredoxin
MHSYRVYVADRESGAETVLTVPSATADEARDKAISQGWLVGRIEGRDPPAAPSKLACIPGVVVCPRCKGIKWRAETPSWVWVAAALIFLPLLLFLLLPQRWICRQCGFAFKGKRPTSIG